MVYVKNTIKIMKIKDRVPKKIERIKVSSVIIIIKYEKQFISIQVLKNSQKFRIKHKKLTRNIKK